MSSTFVEVHHGIGLLLQYGVGKLDDRANHACFASLFIGVEGVQ
jgi:hypothetical protein